MNWNQSSYQHCVTGDLDTRIFCPGRHAGLRIQVFDPEVNDGVGEWLAPHDFPFENNDSSGFLGLGFSNHRLLGIYSLNVIKSIIPHIDQDWEFTLLAGQPLTIMGNGGPPDTVAFQLPKSIYYDNTYNTLWVYSTGHVRLIDFDQDFLTSTLFHRNFRGSFSSFSLNPQGDRIAVLNSCARYYYFNFEIRDNEDSRAINPLPHFLSGPCGSSSLYWGISTPPNGTPSGNGNAYFNSVPQNQDPVYHSNGKLYFGTTGSSNIFVYVSDPIAECECERLCASEEQYGCSSCPSATTTGCISRIAGTEGTAGYNPDDDGQSAQSAQLTSIQQLQELSDGDLLIWDAYRLRRISITTTPNSPTIQTEIDFSTEVEGYTGNGRWYDTIFDEETGVIYYTTANSQVHKIVPLEEPREEFRYVDITYNFNGTTMSGVIKLALTPEGLLVLQPNKSRILVVDP